MNKLHISFLILFLFCGKLLIGNDPTGHSYRYNIKNATEVDALAHHLKNKIVHSKTTLTAPGTYYYVSNSGDDNNDGLSPDKAWKTLDKVSNTILNPGDAVFFKRGELWRGSLHTQAGVSYSTYGNGEKPKIFGSRQNYSVKYKWKETGVDNVYYLDEEIKNDVGVIVFNDGVAHTFKKIAGVDGFDGSISALRNDLDMYHHLEESKVYLYSETGNPADRFSSIEVCQKDHIVKIGGDNITIDNLCIKYGGAHGIGSGSTNRLHVSNCELGWIGGSILSGTTRYGNAVEIWGGCTDYRVESCYIYQIYDAGITHQYKFSGPDEIILMEDIVYRDNLIEYCIYSIEYFLDQSDTGRNKMKNILFENNICRFAGYGWGWQRPDKMGMHIQSWPHRNPAENFVIRGNIFDRSRDKLIYISAEESTSLPRIENNIYIQYRDNNFGFYGENADKTEFTFDKNIREHLIENEIDRHPVVIYSESPIQEKIP
ncbi:hypothetical protein [Proteiniphilum sp.]|uniref:hypothetical protein n=1 Tax=Proteiniphilum sp. TaxID=1926877 RepID=UPI002B21BC12|nr:hypothetical protein [Proteiniphilum sp.]MEA4918317.1 hypothetical protein [Proteiniphilum sp.]